MLGPTVSAAALALPEAGIPEASCLRGHRAGLHGILSAARRTLSTTDLFFSLP